MFFRIKPSGERRYLQIVENVRDGAKTRQSVLCTLGRIDELEADGKLDVLLRSGTRLCATAMLLSSLRDGTLEAASTKRIGGPLVFGRLWEESGCRKVIEDVVGGRGFAFSVERAIFATVLHRLLVSGSDRACERWLAAYRIEGAEGLELHHLYRAMMWLGEGLADQSGATRAPRRTKDVIEERLFERRRSLFSDLSVVLFDTTSLFFYGAGGASLGRHGKSKDHRPDLKQVIVGVVLDAEGRAICSETWPGNATDVKALLPVVDRLRRRFGVARMCMVADRGMISAETIAELEARNIEYILGVRERSDKEVREIVLADSKPMVPLLIPRARGEETMIEVKEVILGSISRTADQRRYVVWATRSWSAMPDTGASSPPRARGISRSTRRASPTMLASMASTCCEPTASCPCSRSLLRIVNCGKWKRSSEPPRRSSRLGRSITRPMRPLSVTCFAPSSALCCARSSTIALPPPGSISSGATSCAISIGSKRSPSIRQTSASCSAPKPQDAPASSSRRSGSLCRRSSVSCRTPSRHNRRPPAQNRR